MKFVYCITIGEIRKSGVCSYVRKEFERKDHKHVNVARRQLLSHVAPINIYIRGMISNEIVKKLEILCELAAFQ